MCNFSNCFHEITVFSLEWDTLLRKANELDVGIEGGYYDARSGCINLWCGPEDKPEDFPSDFEMTCGCFPEPREYVGTVYAERLAPDYTEARLHFCIDALYRAKVSGTESDKAWLIRKFNDLRLATYKTIA